MPCCWRATPSRAGRRSSTRPPNACSSMSAAISRTAPMRGFAACFVPRSSRPRLISSRTPRRSRSPLVLGRVQACSAHPPLGSAGIRAGERPRTGRHPRTAAADGQPAHLPAARQEGLRRAIEFQYVAALRQRRAAGARRGRAAGRAPSRQPARRDGADSVAAACSGAGVSRPQHLFLDRVADSTDPIPRSDGRTAVAADRRSRARCGAADQRRRGGAERRGRRS